MYPFYQFRQNMCKNRFDIWRFFPCLHIYPLLFFTETVKSLVQNVLNTNGHTKPEGDSSLNKELEQQVIDLAGGGPSDNGTANNETANATQATKPCTPEVM